MATGGHNSSTDNGINCSICLEPYRGRQPKLLPCSHNFCLPCLMQIADKEASQSVSSAGDCSLPVTITCPTCKDLPVPLPSAGVSALNNNPNIYGCHDKEDNLQPLLCDLCEEGQEAKLTCPSCKKYFCPRCRQTHDKLCKFKPVMMMMKAEREEENNRQGKEVEPLQVTLISETVQKKLSRDAQQQSKKKVDQEQSCVEPEDEMDAACKTTVIKLLMRKQLDTDKLVSSLQSHVAALQEQKSLFFYRDLAALHDKNTKLERELLCCRKEHEAVQREVASLKDENAVLYKEIQQLCHEVIRLQSAVTKAQHGVGKIQDYAVTLQHQQDTVQGLVGRLKGDVGNLKSFQGQVKQDVKLLSTQVFFQAMLNHDTTLQKNDTLICDHVVTSVGGGYDSQTGVFQAPVSGTYCFMATSSPYSNELNICGNAHIVLENTNVAYFLASGKGSSTAHVSMSVKAGQKVWLRCFTDGRKFSGGSLTWFTGFLLRPEL